jgi:hypothetical protein
VDATRPALRTAKRRLARAEFAAIRNASLGISADAAAEQFDLLMVKLNAPRSMRITGQDVRNGRHNYSWLPAGPHVNPNMFADDEAGTMAAACRPAEAQIPAISDSATDTKSWSKRVYPKENRALDALDSTFRRYDPAAHLEAEGFDLLVPGD